MAMPAAAAAAAALAGPARPLTPDLPPIPADLEAYAGRDAPTLTERGMERFKRARIGDAIDDFDAAAAANPASRPYLWQRGLALYYAGRHADAAEQFAIDVAVNPNDTEESIWHFLARRAGGASLADARREMLRVGEDRRPVMRAAMALFAGAPAGDAELAAVLDRAGGGGSAHDRFYADLYLALWAEAEGDAAAAAARMRDAAAAPYGDSGDYMWHLARVHVRLRGWGGAGGGAGGGAPPEL